MPTDYVAEIQKLDTIQLIEMLSDIKAGKHVVGWAKGKAFEHLMLRGFQIEGAEVVWPYEVKYANYILEQIDGVVYYENIACLIEAKDYKDALDILLVAKLRNQLMRRPAGTMGIIFGRSNFTQPMKDLTRMMNPLQILLWEYEELEYAITNRKMCVALRLKYRQAIELGMSDFNFEGEF